MDTIKRLCAEAAKALVAAATPIIVAFFVDLLTNLSTMATAGITAAVGGAAVYAVANRPRVT